jgi:phosphatidylinositol phospholipase C beta
MRLGFQVDAAGKVPVKVVARTFASGKTEKLIYQAFAELGLPSEKVNNVAIGSQKPVKPFSPYHVCVFCLLTIIQFAHKNLIFLHQGDSMEKADFTFEKFVALYHKICPRNDIEELFQSM